MDKHISRSDGVKSKGQTNLARTRAMDKYHKNQK